MSLLGPKKREIVYVECGKHPGMLTYYWAEKGAECPLCAHLKVCTDRTCPCVRSLLEQPVAGLPDVRIP